MRIRLSPSLYASTIPSAEKYLHRTPSPISFNTDKRMKGSSRRGCRRILRYQTRTTRPPPQKKSQKKKVKLSCFRTESGDGWGDQLTDLGTQLTDNSILVCLLVRYFERGLNRGDLELLLVLFRFSFEAIHNDQGLEHHESLFSVSLCQFLYLPPSLSEPSN